jgi:hypothetical protein
MKRFIALASLTLAAFITSQPALAITGNWVEDNEHPFVGLIVFYDVNGEFAGRCSGSLINPTKFVTAGHCVKLEGAVSARVYFQQDAGANFDPALGYDPITLYPNDCAPGTLGVVCATSSTLRDFDYDSGVLPDTHDLGVVILDQPIQLPEYGELPGPGILDRLARSRGTQKTVFTVSGYGLTYRPADNSVLPFISYRERLMAKSTLVNLTSWINDGYNLQTQGNGSGRGGTCSGDSGGPVFLGGPASNVIVAVTSFGLNALCRGTDFAYRIDRAETLNWINSQ